MLVAVIGAGVQGRAFALACTRAGHSVILEDVMPHKLRHAAAEFAALAASDQDSAAVQLVATVEDAVHSADIVVDFVPDELESKLEIWSLLDRMAPPRTIFCTPSQALSITDLASCTYRPDRCIMVRDAMTPGSPVHLLTARQTSGSTITVAETLFITLGHPVSTFPDPDLPQLLKNMRATSL